MNAGERILTVLLRLGGSLTVTAFLAVFLPGAWMAAIHARLGLGELPRVPIVEYLTRSISLLYGFHGVLLLIVAADVRRHAPIVFFLGVMNVLFGLALTVLDARAGMPWFWTIAEGPPVLGFGLVVLALARSIEPRAARAVSA